MDLTHVIGKRRLREQDAARILIILSELGTPASAQGERVLETEVYLQKLDYLVRSPADLAYVLIDRFEKNAKFSDQKSACMATVRHLATAREPRLRTMGMQKFWYGPWEKLDDVLAFLECRELVRVEPRSGAGGGLTYTVTAKGTEAVRRMYSNWGVMKYYSEQCRVISIWLAELRGTALKDYLYAVLTRIDSADLGKEIPSHGDLVPRRFTEVFGEAL